MASTKSSQPDGSPGRYARENARHDNPSLPEPTLVPIHTPTFMESYERSQVDGLRDDIEAWYPESFF